MKSLGLDVGSNSVGSAWVDTQAQSIHVGVSIFPAGVEESDTKRGQPVGQKRRERRSQRRTIARRARRKRLLRTLLIENRLLPGTEPELDALMSCNPWSLRRDGLRRQLNPHEFGRALLHLAQRRGALGVESEPEDTDAGRTKEAIDSLRSSLGGLTVGEFMADLIERRRRPLADASRDRMYCDPVRNRRGRFEFHATRDMIHDEFERLWAAQRHFRGPLAEILTDELKLKLDDPNGDQTWQCRGAIFGQRRIYWDTGTLGRCDLEPTDRCAPVADRWASHFRVVETANNIRLRERGGAWKPLTEEQRGAVVAALEKQCTATPATVRRALGIHTKTKKEFYQLNIENDPGREINTDWFCREVIHQAVGDKHWASLAEQVREAINRALLKFDPDAEGDEERLRAGCLAWWDFDADQTTRLLAAWKGRPRLERRLNLSRKAIRNLLPYMEVKAADGRWLTQIEARQRFAEDGANGATDEQRARYALEPNRPPKRLRNYARKHPDKLPPPPVLSNPVVRKAIYAVRDHVEQHIVREGCIPDRVVIELAREAKQPARVRNEILARNRQRERARKTVVADFNLGGLTVNQQRAACDRVILCRQQRNLCAYTGRPITDRQAADGDAVETDHIVPWSRSFDDGLNNKVLCLRHANRGKADRTPREWLSAEDFSALIARFERLLVEKPEKGAYFSKRDAQRKLDNLQHEVRDDEWRASQLTDTAYAARQVAAYLQHALYGGADGERANEPGRRRIFFTNGKYTAILRRDWQLFESASANEDDEGGRRPIKSRDDHRHHAIDAVVISLTDGARLGELARAAQLQEQEGTDRRNRKPLQPPWGTVIDFRRDVLGLVYGNSTADGANARGLVVSHRAVKRKLVGALHEETLFGVVSEPDHLFVGRKTVADLTPAHLRMPERWSELDVKARDEALGGPERAGYRRQREALADPAPGKSGLVRDRGLRTALRRALEERGLDPDSFSPAELKQALQTGELRLSSGVPVRAVRLLRVHRDPVAFTAKAADGSGGGRTASVRRRVYVGGNNHHIEIREKGERWEGSLVSAWVAASRVRQPKPHKRVPAVDRSSDERGSFVMSLAEGEMVRVKDPASDSRSNYLVVVKLDAVAGDQGARVQFVHHNDARDSKHRRLIGLRPQQLQDRGAVKVWVNALGEVAELQGD